MNNELFRLKRALACMIGIAAVRADGEAYVPIVLRLEHEISERKAVKSEYDRIKKSALRRTV